MYLFLFYVYVCMCVCVYYVFMQLCMQPCMYACMCQLSLSLSFSLSLSLTHTHIALRAAYCAIAHLFQLNPIRLSARSGLRRVECAQLTLVFSNFLHLRPLVLSHALQARIRGLIQHHSQRCARGLSRGSQCEAPGAESRRPAPCVCLALARKTSTAIRKHPLLGTLARGPVPVPAPASALRRGAVYLAFSVIVVTKKHTSRHRREGFMS